MTGPANYTVCNTLANEPQRRLLYVQNPALGQYYGASAAVGTGTGSYEGLYLSTQKRLSRGLSILANYTWSHCISDDATLQILTSGDGDPANRRSTRGNCLPSDQRQLFNFSAVARTPDFSGRLLRLLASGWQISPVMKLRSAQFFSVTSGTDVALTGQGNQTPNLTGVPVYPANRNSSQWISLAAFAAPSPGQYGTVSLFSFNGPGLFQLDVAASRIFRIREKQTLQARVDIFNLPNHVNLSTPTSAINSSTFGQITSDINATGILGNSGDPRIVQLSMKYVF